MPRSGVEVKGIRLKINGKPFSLSQSTALRLFLDTAPSDELFSLKSLAKASHLNYKTLIGDGSLHSLPEFSNYTHRVGHLRYWGNPKAIAELRRQVGQ